MNLVNHLCDHFSSKGDIFFVLTLGVSVMQMHCNEICVF